MAVNVNLTPELEALVRDQEYQSRLEWLRREIQAGIDSGDAGKLDIEDIKRRGRERLEQLRKR